MWTCDDCSRVEIKHSGDLPDGWKYVTIQTSPAHVRMVHLCLPCREGLALTDAHHIPRIEAGTAR